MAAVSAVAGLVGMDPDAAPTLGFAIAVCVMIPWSAAASTIAYERLSAVPDLEETPGLARVFE